MKAALATTVVLLVAVEIGAGILARSKNDRIAELQGQLAATNADLASKQSELVMVNGRFAFFEHAVAHQAQRDMTYNVIRAAEAGRAFEAGCAPGYTDPRCDGYYGEGAASHGMEALKPFALWYDIRGYGRSLVSSSWKLASASS